VSLDALQQHLLARTLELPSSAKELHRNLRNALLRASNAGQLQTLPGEIYRIVLLLAEPPSQIAQELQERQLHKGAFCIIVGEKKNGEGKHGKTKNQGRDREFPHLTRNDGAWFDFSITVRERGDQLELLAQDFEIRFPPGMGTPFLRFDLNLPAHRNEQREMRCHLHPGSDDILAPAPLMGPLELLGLFVDGLRWPEERKRRDPTAFEVDWFARTHTSFHR
jgi:hypothetical protein